MREDAMKTFKTVEQLTAAGHTASRETVRFVHGEVTHPLEKIGYWPPGYWQLIE